MPSIKDQFESLKSKLKNLNVDNTVESINAYLKKRVETSPPATTTKAVAAKPEPKKEVVRSKAEIKELQKKLNSEGFKLAVDGIIGPKTRDALRISEARSGESGLGVKIARGITKGIVPTNLRMFAESLTGSDATVTEDDLTKNELSRLQEIVRANLKKGKTTITYGDYKDTPRPHSSGNTSKAMISKTKSDPEYNLQTTLGAARIAVMGRDTFVLDRYNFNGAPLEKRTFGERLAGMAADPELTGKAGAAYNLMRNIGKHFGPNEEEGMQVAIKTNQKGRVSKPVPSMQAESTNVDQKLLPGVQLKMNGGQLAQGLAATGIEAFAPGLGSLASPMWSMLEGLIEKRTTGNELKLNPSVRPFAMGGKLKGTYGPGMTAYKGREHRTGGIMVSKNGIPAPGMTEDNVEGGEVLVDLKNLGRHIFSKRLKIK